MIQTKNGAGKVEGGSVIPSGARNLALGLDGSQKKESKRDSSLRSE
jgi:hypothetical protein